MDAKQRRAYMQGVFAHKHKIKRNTNPYKHCLTFRSLWDKGYGDSAHRSLLTARGIRD